MGAIGKTATAVKKTARVTQRATRGTVDWPMALLFGAVLDIRLRREASEAGLNPTHASIRRRLEGATWARWVSAVVVVTALFLTAWRSDWLLAPLIPLAWAILARRAAWWRGQPTLRRMLSPGAWVVMGLSLIPLTVVLFEALFEPLDSELRGWLTHGAGWAATLVAFISALAVAERLKRPVQAVADLSDAELVMEALDMSPTLFQKAVADGSMAVGREGASIRAQLPPGSGKLLDDRDAIAARLAKRNFAWELGPTDPAGRVLALIPLSDEERDRREALDLSRGLFDTANTAGADAPAIQLDIDWDNQSPRS